MKILYIISGTDIQGGATKSFLAMADGVVREGHTVKLVTPDEEGLTIEARKRGWEVLVTPYRFCALPMLKSWRDKLMFFPRLAKTIFQNLRARRIVNRFVREYRPDIIHDNTSVTDIGHYAAKSIDVPNVIHIREYGWKDFRLVLPGLGRRLKYKKSAIIGITNDLTRLRGNKVPADRQITIYNGVIKRESISYNAEKRPEFLYAGRIQHAKGVTDLIDAYINYVDKVGEEDAFKLLMAGNTHTEPSTVKELMRKLEDAGLENKVEWLGEIKDIEKYMAVAAATVIPSYWEGFGRVMPEAMAAGSLCIARPTGGTAEQLSNGRKLLDRDIALEFNDIPELTERLLEVDREFRSGSAFKSGGKFEKMIKDSQKVVEHYYLCEDVGKKTVDFYNRILKQEK